MNYLRHCLVLFLFISVSAAADTAENQNSALDFFKPTDYRQARLSPDGEHFAVTINDDGKARLIIFETSTMKPLAAFRTIKYRDIGHFWWVNNERVVFTQTITRGWLDYPLYTGELFALNIDNSRKWPVAGFAAGDSDGAYYVLDPLKNSKEDIRVVRKTIKKSRISSSRPYAYKLDVYKRPRSSIGNFSPSSMSDKIGSPYPWGDMMADNNGEIRLAYYTDESGSVEVSLRTPDGEWESLPEFKTSSGGVAFELPIVGFTPDNKSVYYLNLGQYDTSALYEFNFESRSSKLLFEHEQFDVEADDLIYTSDKEVIGVNLLGTYPEVHIFSEHPEAKTINDLNAAFPYQRVSIYNYSEDGTKALVDVRSDQNPGMLYLFDRTKPSLSLLIRARSTINTEMMATREPFILRNSDGMLLHGYLTTLDHEAKNQPTIVMIHGGPYGVRDTFLFDSEAQFFAQKGYLVVQVNFRGSGGYGLDFRDAGAKEWANGMIKDINQTTKWAIKKGVADPDKICVYGGSYGAFAAMSATIQEKDLYQCAAGYAGVYDLSRMDESDVPFLPYGEAFLEAAIGTDENIHRQQSPVYFAEEIKIPVLLAHGGEDERAPLVHAELMKEALENAGNEPEWIYHPDEGHGFYDTDHRVDYYERLLGFIEKHLK